MALGKARRARPAGVQPDGVVYRQQYVRCGKAGCTKCPPHGPGHGPYWYGFYWDYRQRTRSFYVGKALPPGVEPLGEMPKQPDAPAPVAPADEDRSPESP